MSKAGFRPARARQIGRRTKELVFRRLTTLVADGRGYMLPPATPAELASLRRRVPETTDEMVQWLRVFAAFNVCGHLFYGARPVRRGFESIVTARRYLRTLPRVLPVCSDGCGNYYVSDLSRGGFVGFVEAAERERIRYYLASSISKFLLMLTEALVVDDADWLWEFDRKYAKKRDPRLVRQRGLVHAWEADG